MMEIDVPEKQLEFPKTSSELVQPKLWPDGDNDIWHLVFKRPKLIINIMFTLKIFTFQNLPVKSDYS